MRPAFASKPAANLSTTLFILDDASNVKFLVDSGADVSLIPPSPDDVKADHRGPPLVAANGSTIRSFGIRSLHLQLQGRKFHWSFVVADVRQSIIGADFLRAHALMVNLHQRCLVSSDDLSTIKGTSAPPAPPRASRVEVSQPSRFQRLLKDRPVLTTPSFRSEQPAHGVQLHIPTTGPPLYARARRLAPDKLEAARQEFKLMENLGIIQRSKSPWASPLHIVPKKDGGFRPCGDYRRLNVVTEADKYPIPYLHDATNFLRGKTIFSKVDLVKSYYQIPVAVDDVPKTAVITPFGLFEWKRCPFGLKNAAQAFQRLMHRVLEDLPFVYVYMDDLLCASTSADEHVQHLATLFDRLEAHGLIVNPDKCALGQSELEFLGHHISAAGSAPLPEKVAAVSQFQPPTTAQEILRFAGMINFYNKYIPHINLRLAPLFAAAAGKKKTEAVPWTPQLEAAFKTSKRALATATMLVYPSMQAPTALTTDASDTGVGAVLEQFLEGKWKPLAFFSRRFRTPETKYSTFDRELLAVHLAIRHFRFFLEGRSFTIFTDHKPLTLAIKKSTDPQSARQGRHLAAIAEYSTDIQHVAGKANPVADALSRTLPTPPPCDVADIVIPPAVMQVSSSQVQPPPVVRAGSPAIGATTAAAFDQQGGELHRGPPDRGWPAKAVRAGPPAVGTAKAVTLLQVQPPPVVRAGSPAIGTTTAAALVQQVVRAGPPAVGTTKVVAPVLHTPDSATHLPSIAAEQELDDDLTRFVNDHVGKLQFKRIALPDDPHTVICEMSTGTPRPLIPPSRRQAVVDQLHGIAHPGVKATLRLVKERFFWPNMDKDIRSWTKTCVACQTSKVHRHTRTPTSFIAMPAGRFQHVHVDLVGPLPPARGFTYLLTIVDRFSRWPEAIPITDIRAQTVCDAFLFHWVARFGVPLLISSDRGTQFTSSLWSLMSSSLGIRLQPTTAYHPQANGLVERLHRRLKEALKARLQGPDWHEQLPWILLSLRITVKEDLECTPADLVYGSALAIPGDCLPSSATPCEQDFVQGLRRTVQNLRPLQTSHHTATDTPCRPLPPETAFVFVRRDGYKAPLTAAYEGPFEVLSQGPKTLRIRKPAGDDTVAADRCKPALLDQHWPPPTGLPPPPPSTVSPPPSPPQPEPPPPQRTLSPPPARRRQTKLPSKYNDFEMSAAPQGGGTPVAPLSDA